MHIALAILIIFALTLSLSLSLQASQESPTSVLDQDFVRILSPLSGSQAFQNFNSSQYGAIFWLSTQDKEYSSTLTPEALVQRFVAATLYIARADAVEGFLPLSMEPKALHECEWHGVMDKKHEMGIFCDESYMITRVDLVGADTPGTELPPEVSALRNLTHLALVNVFSGGKIPENVNNLARLEYLDLSGNVLSGSIPASLGNLGKVERFILENNNLAGSIPSNLAAMTSLSFLNMRMNNIVGSLDALCQTGALVDADCSNESNQTFCSCCASCRDSEECKPSDHFVQVEVETDVWGRETTFHFVRNEIYENVIADSGPFSSDTKYSYSFCIPFPGSYSFVVYDSEGNGLNSGGITGQISLFNNGKLFAATGEFGSKVQFELTST